MIKATSILTALGLALSSFSLGAVPARAGNAGGVVAGGIIGFAAGAIVGSQLSKNKNRNKTYRNGSSGRSQEEREYWMTIQDALNRVGYDAGPVDGAPGRRTRQAIRDFQVSIPAVPDGKLTPEQTQLLYARAYPQAEAGQPGYAAPPANYQQQPGPGFPNVTLPDNNTGPSALPAQPGQPQMAFPAPQGAQNAPQVTQPAQTPNFPSVTNANVPSETGQQGAQPTLTFPAVNQGTPQVSQQPIVAAGNSPTPVATAPAPEVAPAANAQPPVQVDEEGRQFIEMNGQKFYLEQQ